MVKEIETMHISSLFPFLTGLINEKTIRGIIMPELPEVETVRRGLEAELLHKEVSGLKIYYDKILKNVKSPQEFQQILVGCQLSSFERIGKYLIINLDKTDNNKKHYLIIHLRMTGQLFIRKEDTFKRDKHTHLVISFKDSNYLMIYRDIRKFGSWEIIDDLNSYFTKRKIKDDALTISFDPFFQKLQKSSRSLKSLLLDQTIIAGLGNIYVDEALFRAKLSPFRFGNELKKIEAIKLLDVIKKTLQQAVFEGGTSFSDYVNSYGEKGNFQLQLLVYKREGQPCSNCGTPIIKTKLAGRGTRYCKNCQK